MALSKKNTLHFSGFFHSTVQIMAKRLQMQQPWIWLKKNESLFHASVNYSLVHYIPSSRYSESTQEILAQFTTINPKPKSENYEPSHKGINRVQWSEVETIIKNTNNISNMD